jgi:hypothetical protein
MATKRGKLKPQHGRSAPPAGERLSKPDEAVLRKLAAAPRKPPRRLSR